MNQELQELCTKRGARAGQIARQEKGCSVRGQLGNGVLGEPVDNRESISQKPGKNSPGKCLIYIFVKPLRHRVSS